MALLFALLALFTAGAAQAGSVNETPPHVAGQPHVCIHGTLDRFGEALANRYLGVVQREMTGEQFAALRANPRFRDSTGDHARWWSLKGMNDVVVVMADEHGCAKWRWNIPIPAFEELTGITVWPGK